MWTKPETKTERNQKIFSSSLLGCKVVGAILILVDGRHFKENSLSYKGEVSKLLEELKKFQKIEEKFYTNLF